MNRFFTLASFIIFSFSVLGNTSKISLEEYIDAWKEVAIKQMKTHGIPASIILSQGILESGFGNSKLALQANNHFGIKCHDWTGETFLKDDDKKNECFRKYKDAAQSYEDHSIFLSSRSRYDFLFEIEITDYKSWAKGLKTAGYATNPKYPKRLIEIIERYDLNQYDQKDNNYWIVENNKVSTSNELEPSIEIDRNKKSTHKKASQQLASHSQNKHKVYVNQNRTKYVIAGEHDTFYLIAKEFGYNLRQLNRWNDFPSHKDVLSEGDKVYIMRKRKRVKSELALKEVQNNMKLWKVAQKHGVQLSSLIEFSKNNSSSIAMNKKDF